jgi:hypothetical protein
VYWGRCLCGSCRSACVYVLCVGGAGFVCVCVLCVLYACIVCVCVCVCVCGVFMHVNICSNIFPQTSKKNKN